MRIKDLCKDERPREKLLVHGKETLSNSELLAILLRTGTGRKNVIDVARELLISGDGKLNALASMSVEGLCRIDGIGPGKAVSIAAAFELGRRCAAEPIVDSKTSVSSPKMVFRMMLPLLRGLDHEECWILYMNRANYLISKEKVSSGGLDSTILDSKVIVRKAIERKASGIIICHNHPSGSSLPGSADIQATRQIEKALKICDISLIDHVIIAEDSYYSFADEQEERF
jgi:DNA repair protein RadC